MMVMVESCLPSLAVCNRFLCQNLTAAVMAWAKLSIQGCKVLYFSSYSHPHVSDILSLGMY